MPKESRTFSYVCCCTHTCVCTAHLGEPVYVCLPLGQEARLENHLLSHLKSWQSSLFSFLRGRSPSRTHPHPALSCLNSRAACCAAESSREHWPGLRTLWLRPLDFLVSVMKKTRSSRIITSDFLDSSSVLFTLAQSPPPLKILLSLLSVL